MLYPNPAKNNLIVEYSVSENEFINLQIYDVHGRQLNTTDLSPNENQIEIDISNLSEGIYFIKIERNDKLIFTQRVIVVD